MDSALEKLDINASARDIEDYLERFEIWCMTKGNVKEDTKPALFLNFIGKDAYALIRNLTFPDSPIAMPYEKIRNALISALRRGWKESENDDSFTLFTTRRIIFYTRWITLFSRSDCNSSQSASKGFI